MMRNYRDIADKEDLFPCARNGIVDVVVILQLWANIPERIVAAR